MFPFDISRTLRSIDSEKMAKPSRAKSSSSESISDGSDDERANDQVNSEEDEEELEAVARTAEDFDEEEEEEDNDEATAAGDEEIEVCTFELVCLVNSDCSFGSMEFEVIGFSLLLRTLLLSLVGRRLILIK